MDFKLVIRTQILETG